MASGTIKGSFSGTSSSNAYPSIEWSSSENISSNNSSVSAILYFNTPNSNWKPYNLESPSATIKINGNNASAGRNIDMRSTNKQEIWRRTVTVGHNSDGSKSCNIGASGSTGLNLGSYNFSANVTLPKIARAATFTMNKTTANFGETFNINIKSVSNYKYTVNAQLPGGSVNLLDKGAGGSHNFSIANSYMSRIPNGTSTSFKVWVDTYSGNTKIGTNWRTLKLNVPSNIAPTVSSITASDTNAKSSALGIYVQSISEVKLSASASGTYGSSIKSYNFKLGNQSRNGSSSTQQFTANQLSNSGTVACTVEVIDSRGRKASKSVNISVQAYTPPTITKFTATRNATTPTTINITKAGSYNNLGGKNPATWTLEFKLATASTYGASGISVTDGTNSYNKTGVKADASYQFRLTLKDKITEDNKVQDVKTTKVLFDLNRDIGVGIGKMNEGKGTLEVGGAMFLDGIITAAPNRWAAAGTAGDGNEYAYAGGTFNGQNSDMTGINGIYFGGGDPTNAAGVDPAQGNGEGILFPKSKTVIDWSKTMTASERDSNWDNFRIMDGIGYLNGIPVMMDTYQELWSGAVYPQANQTITPSVHIKDCPNGWMVVWSDYASGVSNNYDWVYTPIHKWHADGSGGGVQCIVASGHNQFLTKYIYINNVTIVGSDRNIDSDKAKNVVIRRVLAF